MGCSFFARWVGARHGLKSVMDLQLPSCSPQESKSSRQEGHEMMVLPRDDRSNPEIRFRNIRFIVAKQNEALYIRIQSLTPYHSALV